MILGYAGRARKLRRVAASIRIEIHGYFESLGMTT